MKWVLLLAYIGVMQAAFVCMMSSMGETRNDIEFTRRLLDENRFAAKVAKERILRLSLRSGNSTDEHTYLRVKITKISRREEEIREELGSLLELALFQQIKVGE
jgi:hypothetical protein